MDEPYWEASGTERWIFRTKATPEPLGVVFADGLGLYEWYLTGRGLSGRNWSRNVAMQLVEKHLNRRSA